MTERHFSPDQITPMDEKTLSGPCVFCHRDLVHFNEGGDGWIAGAVKTDGELVLFMYCHQFGCDGAHWLWRCECESVGGTSYVENLGGVCHGCGHAPSKGLGSKLEKLLRHVLSGPECTSKCLDDDDDREAVLHEIVRVLNIED